MRGLPVQFFLRTVVTGIALLWASAAHAFNLVDVIPSSLSGETAQNSEPNIAVNPINPAQAVISSFGGNPYFATGNAGTTWAVFDSVAHNDTSLDWGRDGATANMARLSIPAKNIEAFSSPNPVGGVPWTPNASSSYTSGVGTTTNFPDQPWLVTGRGLDPASNTVKDRIYIGFNDLGLYPGRTASVRSSTDGGATWTNTVIESAVPAGRQDDPSVRVAVNGNTVYAVFARWGTDAFHGTGVARFSDVVIVRDDNGATGPTKFGALGITGVPIVTTQVPFTVGTPGPSNQVSLGNERIAATLAIAVDPNDKNHVYVAVTEVPGTVNSGQMRVAVYESR